MNICYTDEDRCINLRWRDKNGNRLSKTIEDFRPYFYVRAIEREVAGYDIKETVGGRKVKLWYPFEYETGDWVNLQGAILKRVYVHKPQDIKVARELFNETYEADVKFIDRYAVDELKDIPDSKLRKCYWDMEWLNADPVHGDAITCIVAYDNYDEEYNTFVWFPDNTVRLFDFGKGKVLTYNNEREMLDKFLTYIQDKDPDMLLAWFGLKFDLPKLIHRCIFNGLDPRRLSPYNSVSGIYWTQGGIKASKKVDSYGDIYQPIKGRITLNLDLAFERQWNDAQRGTLPSLALDDVCELALGEKKLVSEKFPDKDDFFKRGWLEDTETYLEYARIDVELLVKLDETNFCSDAILSLQRILLAPFESCLHVSKMGGIYFMRNATWKCPTGKSSGKKQYDGAMIYDPLSEGTNGLYLNVAAFDFAGLYPSMMISRNISWETKSNEPTPFAVNIATPRDFSPIKTKVMRYYKTDKLGLLPTAVLELKELRDNYKKKMYDARANGNKEEYNKWYVNQMAVKRLSASFYGVVAYQGFGWCDIDLAASITASAREAIRSAAFEVRRLNDELNA